MSGAAVWFTQEPETDYEEESSPPTWNLVQFVLAIFCTLSVGLWFRLPLSFFFGSGWAIIGMILFMLLFAPPLIYIQIRLGCQLRRGMLGLFDKYFPLSIGFGIGCFVRNLISVIYVSGIMTLCLSYIFFSVYPCDGKYCIEAPYMWQSCNNFWNQEGACMQGRKEILNEPTEEEKFFFNFVLDRSENIAISAGFAKWFDLHALILVPHVLTWIIVFLTIIGGAAAFGWILYFVIPTAFSILLAGIIFFFLRVANERGMREDYLNRFFTNFAARIPLSQSAWDQFKFEPIIWGLLSTFVHLSMSLNLWNGVYPIMGKWVGNGKLRRHFMWVVIWLLFGLFAVMPTLLIVSTLAANFNRDYLRCQMGLGWAMPFVLVAHTISKFAIHKVFAVAFFLCLFLFLLISQALLIVTSLENAVDHMRLWHTRVARNQRRVYRLFCVFLTLLFFPLSMPYIIRSSYYWITLLDHYLDRLMCVLIFGQGVAYFLCYARSKSKESKLLKLFLMIHLGLSVLFSVAIFIWYAADTESPMASQSCQYEQPKPGVDPLLSSYRALGWIVAFAPFLLGLIISLPLIWYHSRRQQSSNCCAYLVQGEKAQTHLEREQQPLNDPSTMSSYAQPMHTLTKFSHA